MGNGKCRSTTPGHRTGDPQTRTKKEPKTKTERRGQRRREDGGGRSLKEEVNGPATRCRVAGNVTPQVVVGRSTPLNLGRRPRTRTERTTDIHHSIPEGTDGGPRDPSRTPSRPSPHLALLVFTHNPTLVQGLEGFGHPKRVSGSGVQNSRRCSSPLLCRFTQRCPVQHVFIACIRPPGLRSGDSGRSVREGERLENRQS